MLSSACIVALNVCLSFYYIAKVPRSWHSSRVTWSRSLFLPVPLQTCRTMLHEVFSNHLTPASFPPPKIFTKALLGNHEITNLIRDTEAHEWALFSLTAEPPTSSSSRKSTRRGTLFYGEDNGSINRKSTFNLHEPRKHSAVARVLGGEMLHEIQQSRSLAKSQNNGVVGSVNVEALLRGAEKLCAV